MRLVIYGFFGVVVIVFIVCILIDINRVFFFLIVLLNVGFVFVVVFFDVVL